MNTTVHDVLSIEARFILEILIELLVDIIFHHLEAATGVDRIAIAWSINL